MNCAFGLNGVGHLNKSPKFVIEAKQKKRKKKRFVVCFSVVQLFLSRCCALLFFFRCFSSFKFEIIHDIFFVVVASSVFFFIRSLCILIHRGSYSPMKIIFVQFLLYMPIHINSFGH